MIWAEGLDLEEDDAEQRREWRSLVRLWLSRWATVLGMADLAQEAEWQLKDDGQDDDDHAEEDLLD